jgi:alpha-glucosidase
MTKMTARLFLFLFLLIPSVRAQLYIVVDQVPADTPEDATIFISGDFEGWTGGQSGYELAQSEDGTYSYTMEQREGSIAFKFTLGGWEKVEKGANGEEIGNRTYTFGGNGDTLYCTVENWADGTSGGGNSTRAENVNILSESFYIPQLDRNRRIWVYLPPGYENSASKYPVLYMHDGQNLFDASTSFAGEWEVDETLNNLYDQYGIELIVIGIDNGGVYRTDEYTPFRNPTYGGGNGDKYLQFVVQTLKPYVDQNYRSLPGKNSTAIMGSSLGGLISHYGALKYKDTFGKAGIFSPSFWWSDSLYRFAAQEAIDGSGKMYFMCGDSESESVVPNMNKMIREMIDVGYDEGAIESKVVTGGQHNEKLWREGFSEAILFLFADEITAIRPGVVEGVNIYPNPAKERLFIDGGQQKEPYLLSIYNLSGKLLLQEKLKGKKRIVTESFHPGLYLVKIETADQTEVFRIAIR